ncbi:DUF2934 domain-containing protein [Tolumonas osonensis]|uniref:DUF2934 domain-containing protein n=1 Tax=Tolumonas osonensis TaxID=675874 RepID=A0A841GAK3_9GAMM|nr:DUF2934 domain-containing protein [Tolumonas osonensis]MBB6056088.1 hypothetical protein [Tolumonas osonensis]
MRKPKSSPAKPVKRSIPEPIVEPAPSVTEEERCRMIAEAAYFRAEKRGFTDGNTEEDWLEAEAEVDQALQQQETAQKIAATAKEVEHLIQSVLENDTASISDRVRAITLNAFAGAKLEPEALKQIINTVIKGAQQGASGRGEHEAKLLKDAMQGLDDALAAAAEATQLALQEAANRSSEFSRQGLKKTIDDLATLESLFIETISTAARNATGTAQATLHDLVQHAQNSGTAVGQKVESAVSRLAHVLVDTSREQMSAGAQTLRKEGALFAGIVSGVLKGVAAQLQAKPDKKPAPRSSGRGK